MFFSFPLFFFSIILSSKPFLLNTPLLYKNYLIKLFSASFEMNPDSLSYIIELISANFSSKDFFLCTYFYFSLAFHCVSSFLSSVCFEVDNFLVLERMDCSIFSISFRLFLVQRYFSKIEALPFPNY